MSSIRPTVQRLCQFFGLGESWVSERGLSVSNPSPEDKQLHITVCMSEIRRIQAPPLLSADVSWLLGTHSLDTLQFLGQQI